MAARRIEGKEITVLFDGSRCIHARNCVLARPDVFVPNQRGEWIFPDAAQPGQIREIAHNCPSGAIRYEATAESEPTPNVNTIRVRENGPLVVHGQLKIGTDTNMRATLCRCGQSANKPYCDGAHTKHQFSATGEPETGDPKILDARDGELDVAAVENGPLKVTGNAEIVSGTGRTVNRTTKAFLCRCGQSKNKPYCDGSHKHSGFEADAV